MQDAWVELQSLEKAEEDAAGIQAAIMPLIEAVGVEGGSALLVGGSVRDVLLDRPAKDLDVEAFGIDAERLKSLLSRSGTVNLVGQSFAVFKYRPKAEPDLEVDVSLPRRDVKSGPGHRGFTVSYDPGLSPSEASKRRDLTINAIFYDPLARTFIDPHWRINALSMRLLQPLDTRTFFPASP